MPGWCCCWCRSSWWCLQRQAPAVKGARIGSLRNRLLCAGARFILLLPLPPTPFYRLLCDADNSSNKDGGREWPTHPPRSARTTFSGTDDRKRKRRRRPPFRSSSHPRPFTSLCSPHRSTPSLLLPSARTPRAVLYAAPLLSPRPRDCARTKTSRPSSIPAAHWPSHLKYPKTTPTSLEILLTSHAVARIFVLATRYIRYLACIGSRQSFDRDIRRARAI